MPTYVLLSHFSADAIVDPPEIINLDAMVKRRVRAECEGVEWLDSYVLLGRYDSLDLFQAPSNEVASKVALIVRSFGHATTEVMPATSWLDFAATIDASTAEASVQDPGQVDAREAAVEDKVDEAMVQSFPASDPPSFSPG